MSVDKLVDSTQLNADLTSVANAIRTKGGTSASLAFPADFISAINAISGGGGLKYKTGSFTLPSDVWDSMMSAGNGIAHGLGAVPKCVIVWQETYTDSNIPTVQVNAGYIYLLRIMDIDQRITSSGKDGHSFYVNLQIAANSTVGATVTAPNSESYMPDIDPTSTEFYLYKTGNSNNKYRSGVAYKYFVSEAWW